MIRSEAKAFLKWLNSNPPLQELMDRCPGEWEEAGGRMVAALKNSRALTTEEAPTKAQSDLEVWTRRIEKRGSRYRFAGGNWEAYTGQQRFEWQADPRLSGFVLPPELESSVLVFHRKK